MKACHFVFFFFFGFRQLRSQIPFLLASLQEMTLREILNCVLTAMRILSGQGWVDMLLL